MSARGQRARPIVVTGCPRSGTTFVGKIIGSAREVFYVYEPFNNDAPHHLPVKERFIHLTDETAAPMRADLDALMDLGSLSSRARLSVKGIAQYRAKEPSTVARLAARELVYKRDKFFSATRTLVKDPLAFYAAEWLDDTYEADVVVMVRHPAGVISSYVSLKWPSETEALLDRPVPADRPELAAALTRFRDGPRDYLDGLILQWKLFAATTIDMARRRPDWTFVIHDSLCLSPDAYFSALFDRLGLAYSAGIRAKVTNDTAADKPVDTGEHRQHQHQRNASDLVDAWRDRLPEAMADRVLEETRDLWLEAQEVIAPITNDNQKLAATG